MADLLVEKAHSKLRQARERFGHMLPQNIGYLGGIVQNDDGTTVLEVLPLEGIAGAKPMPIDAQLAFMVGQAVGFYGYRPDPSRPGAMPDILEVLRKGGRLPLTPLVPVRNPDGSTDEAEPPESTQSQTNPSEATLRARMQSCYGCFVCDIPGGCYCVHCP